MVNIDCFQLLLGKDTYIRINDFCEVRQPTLGDISKIGHDRYQSYLSTFLVKKSELLKTLGTEDGPEYDPYSLWDIMLVIPELRANLLAALDFFVVGDISADEGSICVDEKSLSNMDLHDIAAAVSKISCIEMDDESQHVFASERTRRLWEKMQKGRQELRKAKNQDGNIDLFNLISAVAARGCGYTLFNIWDLTVYQLYDQFARINVGVQMDIYSSRWAAWGKDDFDVSLWFKNLQSKEGNKA